jgi:hypothetical protein
MDMYNRHYAPAATAMWAYPNIRQHPYMTPQQAMAVYHQNPHMREWAARAAMMSTKTTETKPRLAKEEVEQLEAEFQKNPKPNSSLKKGLAEQMRVDVARINNWFQNRRAKAKQEKRTAEFEAKQRLEKERAEPQVSEFFGDSNHCDSLRPSSAPLPIQQDSAASTSSQSPAAQDSDAPSAEHEDSTEDTARSPNNFTSPASVFVTTETEPADLSYIFQDQPDMADLSSIIKQEPASEASSVAESPFAGYVIPSFQVYNDVHSAAQHDHANSDVEYSHSSPESLVQSPPQSVFRSPPSTIASRRNAPRPAPLGLNALRAHVQPGPKTVDGSRMHDGRPGSSMRRVSSASGSVRIQKSVSASPLNRYVERKPEMLLQLARSPNQMVNTIAAPPTPETPQLCAQQQADREASISSDDSAYSAFVSSLPSAHLGVDPTLKTPPTTPGLLSNISEALFVGDAQYAHYDESLGSAFGSDADFSTMSSTSSMQGMQHYFASSQPVTPSFPPSHPGYAMAAAAGPVISHYQIYPGSNTDYNWPEPSSITSTQSSPGMTSQGHFQTHFTFNNSTPNDYCEPRC